MKRSIIKTMIRMMKYVRSVMLQRTGVSVGRLMMNKFESIAFLMRTARNRTDISQDKLSKALGYKNGQYISNLERGLCGLPVNKIKDVSLLLGVEEPLFIHAMVQDFERNIKRELYSKGAFE